MTPSLNYETWFDRGLTHHDRNQLTEALDCFQHAIDSNPHFIPGWVYKGIVLEQLEDYKAAIDCYTQALTINPDTTDLWYNKGATLCRIHHYTDALTCFDRVLELDPHHAICQTTRTLTLATLSKTIKPPKFPELEADGKPTEAEATVERTLTVEKQRTMERGDLEIELE